MWSVITSDTIWSKKQVCQGSRNYKAIRNLNASLSIEKEQIYKSCKSRGLFSRTIVIRLTKILWVLNLTSTKDYDIL